MKRSGAAFVLACAVLAAVLGCTPAADSKDSIVLATVPFESIGLVFVAQDQGLFADHGLDVKFQEHATGVAALDAVLNDSADLAVGTAEFPLLSRAFSQAPISAIATIDRPDFIYLIGRKDRGIVQETDLRGKRIGTTLGSVAQFYLGRFLELNGMTTRDITFVDLKTPDEWRGAIADGTVDAVVLAQPEASVVERGLGDNATFFSVQEGQPAYTLAIARNEWIADHPKSVEKFLAALADAEKYMATNPDEALSIVQKKLDLDADYMELVRGQNAFGLSLDQSLILAMEDEARWMIRNSLTTATVVPDFGKYVDTTGLKKVMPAAVNVLP